LAILLLTAVTYFVTQEKLRGRAVAPALPVAELRDTAVARGVTETRNEVRPHAAFECDGRTHCSHMRS
jgi:hypothetical protein